MVRVTLLEQLSVVEFIGESTRPKVYDNGHKKVLGVWFGIEGQILQNSDIQSNFSMSKTSRIFMIFFSLRNTKMGD